MGDETVTVQDGPLTLLMAEVRRRYDTCFACGPANHGGLHLDGFAVEGDEVVAPFHPRQEHNGFEGVLHGGIIATALDEICAWAAMAFESTFVVTGRFEVRYARRAPADGSYELRGRVDQRRASRLRRSGRLLRDDEAVASASGLYLATASAFVGDEHI